MPVSIKRRTQVASYLVHSNNHVLMYLTKTSSSAIADTALKGGLVMARSGRLQLGNYILRAL